MRQKTSIGAWRAWQKKPQYKDYSNRRDEDLTKRREDNQQQVDQAQALKGNTTRSTQVQAGPENANRSDSQLQPTSSIKSAPLKEWSDTSKPTSRKRRAAVGSSGANKRVALDPKKFLESVAGSTIRAKAQLRPPQVKVKG